MADDFQRVRANVEKMIQMKAPEADIDGYLQSEGLTPAQFKDRVSGISANQARVAEVVTSPSFLPGMGQKIAEAESFGPAMTALRAAGQGAMLNYGDELGGVLGGYLPALASGEDPTQAYKRVRDQYRAQDKTEAAANPKSAMGGNIAGQMLTGTAATLATGGTSLPAVLGLGAAQGAISGSGASEATDYAQLAKDALAGGAFGLGGAAVGYAGGKLIERLLNRGIAYNTITKALDGNTDELLAQMKSRGVSAAEADDVLKEVLRAQAARNPTAAARAIPGAEARVSQVAGQTVDDINRMVSPDNANLLIQQLQDRARSMANPGYGNAYANPAQLGLVPEMMRAPGMSDALDAAEQLAKFQGRPFDPNALTVQDLDAMQRFLRLKGEKAFSGDALETLKGPNYTASHRSVNDLAGQVSPELAQTQAQYAALKATQEAVDLGKKAFDPSKEAAEIADEFSKLSPEGQEGYRAGLATKLRSMIGSKSSKANVGAIFEKYAIADKLKAVGFPEDQINEITRRGGDARGVLDALVGGSDTAKKLGAAEASKSAITKFGETAGSDLTTAGILKSPWSLVLLPLMRSIGQSQDRAVASQLIDALTDQSGNAMRGLLRMAPQTTTTPALGLLGRAGGGYEAGR